MSTTMPKAQRDIMMVLPLVFISVVAHFPAGLVLYWVTTNLWTVGQGLVTRRLVPKTPLGPAGPARRRRRRSRRRRLRRQRRAAGAAEAEAEAAAKQQPPRA